MLSRREGASVVSGAVVGKGIVVVCPGDLAWWDIELEGRDIAVGKAAFGQLVIV